MREILNKRLTKTRKDLEDASESTGLNLRRVTRQFDNIRRIYSEFEDASITQVGNVYRFIAKNYLLSNYLVKKYTCLVFLLYTKFNLTSKRRIQRVPCENLEYASALILVFLALDGQSYLKLLAAETSTG